MVAMESTLSETFTDLIPGVLAAVIVVTYCTVAVVLVKVLTRAMPPDVVLFDDMSKSPTCNALPLGTVIVLRAIDVVPELIAAEVTYMLNPSSP